MMMFFGDFLQLADIQKTGEFIKMKHRFVLAVIAEKRNVLAEEHILQMIRDKASIASLNALAKFDYDFRLVFHHFEDFITR